MSNFYNCTVCDQAIPEEDIIQIQNTRSTIRTWKECPVCGSKVFLLADENFDVKEMVKFQYHKAVS